MLDLDLDFFLSRVPRRVPGSRRADRVGQAWHGDEVRRFLRECCGLHRSRGVRVEVVEHHDAAFDVTRDAIHSGLLHPHLDWVHVDAHADLGMSNAGHRYVLTTLMAMPTSARSIAIDRSYLRPGNYLLFLAACGWLRRLTYVVHPHRYVDDVLVHDDRTPCYFRGQNPESAWLDLGCHDRDGLRFANPAHLGFGYRLSRDVPAEVSVRCDTRPAWSHVDDGGYDMVVVARSPDYTPPAVDAFVDIVRDLVASG